MIHIDLSSAYVRIALRAYFTVFLLLLGFLGDRCCAKRVKLRLYRHQNVGISQMTGWLSGIDAAMAWVTMRVSAAGWIGPVMILASLLSIVCDLAVSGLVVGVEVVSRCPFITTGMYTAIANTPLPARTYVTNAGPLYNLITQAQSTSLLNGGLDGIFSKVNTNAKFRADPEDIVGQWICDATGERRSFPASKTPTAGDDITSALLEDGLLFNQTQSTCWTVHPDNSINQLFIWSASQDDYPTKPWQVRAAVETTENSEAEKVLEMYTCQMHAHSVDWVLQETVPRTALGNWCEEIKGALFPNNIAHATELLTDPRLIMASNLNNIIMNSGAAWNDAVSPLVIDDPTQGCLAPRAVVPWPIVILFGIVTATTIAASIYWILLTLLVGTARKRSSADYVRAVEDRTPNGLFSWMRRTAYETNKKWEADDTWAKRWAFGPTLGHKSTSLLLMVGDDEQSVPLSVPVNIQHTIKRKPVPSWQLDYGGKWSLHSSEGNYTYLNE
jgi:hypothetical protein